MELTQIAHSLGISQYPSALNELYASGNLCDPCDPALLEELQTQHNILGPYYDITRQAMLSLPKDPCRYAWAKVVATYLFTAPVELASKVPMPATDGTTVGDLLPLLILLPQIPVAVEAYRSKGFSPEAVAELTQVYGRCIAIVEKILGRPGINQLYYWWLCLYAKASIFHCGSFQFELRQLPKDTVFLQSLSSDALVPLMVTGTYHRSGQVLGCGSYTDPQGAFSVSLRETEDAWYGFPAIDGIVSPKEICFPKTQWRCALRPGDTVLSMHIAKGADLSPAALDNILIQATEIARRSFPQWNTNAIHCRSWLLDPVLCDILGENSNIARFGSRFFRHPIRSNGRKGFDYVFPSGVPDAQLPETTRLQRGLKAHYLAGGGVYGCAGAFIIK
jgi:hypothetical protein